MKEKIETEGDLEKQEGQELILSAEEVGLIRHWAAVELKHGEETIERYKAFEGTEKEPIAKEAIGGVEKARAKITTLLKKLESVQE